MPKTYLIWSLAKFPAFHFGLVFVSSFWVLPYCLSSFNTNWKLVSTGLSLLTGPSITFRVFQFLVLSQWRHILCSPSFPKMFNYIIDVFDTFWHINFKFVITVFKVWIAVFKIWYRGYYHHSMSLTVLSSRWVQKEYFKLASGTNSKTAPLVDTHV